ncbi:PAP17 [Symbiodinium natans]|uniref:PAP17 protein n=1 Tax=Symbiodinium natans TaxID=878477 RepID=A0A812KD08_9DINO|nr:PAP17 [Symbiodinium natans]
MTPARPPSQPPKGLHHFFVIGDWGGVIDWFDRDANFVPGVLFNITFDCCRRYAKATHPYTVEVKSPKTADHTKKVFASHHRKKVNSSDTWAQFNVSRWMCYYAKKWDPEFIVNLGDNFYWGGLNVQCGAPMDQVQDPGFQWSNIYEVMYSCDGLEGKQWLGVLGNHDYGGFMFTNGWDQVIAYTWSTLKFSTGRWLQPALYYKCPVKFNDFSMDFFFVDSNLFDANDYHDTSGHNICAGTHNYPSATCGLSGPVSTEQCADWFKNLWDAEVKWLEEGLGSSTADWQIIATHFPPEHGLDQWRRLSKSYGVDLLLTAHRHVQEVHVDDEANILHPTSFVVSGGGGGITSEAVPSENGEDDQYGFMDFTVSKHEIKITAVSHGGQVRSIKCLTQRLPGDDHTQEPRSSFWHPLDLRDVEGSSCRTLVGWLQ